MFILGAGVLHVATVVIVRCVWRFGGVWWLCKQGSRLRLQVTLWLWLYPNPNPTQLVDSDWIPNPSLIIHSLLLSTRCSPLLEWADPLLPLLLRLVLLPPFRSTSFWTHLAGRPASQVLRLLPPRFVRLGLLWIRQAFSGCLR